MLIDILTIPLLTAGLLLAQDQAPNAPEGYQSLSALIRSRAQSQGPPAAKSVDSHEIIRRLQHLAEREIEAALADPAATSESVEQSLNRLQGSESLRAFLSESKVPYAHLARVSGSPVCVAAFAVLSGGDAIPGVDAHIQFYSRASATWKLQADVGSEFDGRAFSLAPIRSAIPGEIWYLAWGTVIGDTGARLRLRLYGFDGWTVRTVSARDELRGGTVQVSPSEVRLAYFERPPEGVIVPPKPVVEILRPSANGLVTYSLGDAKEDR